jgi:hypothetical protein
MWAVGLGSQLALNLRVLLVHSISPQNDVTGPFIIGNDITRKTKKICMLHASFIDRDSADASI